MREFEVNCINKSGHIRSHEEVTHIGNWVGKWRVSREMAIARIEANVEAYFTVDKSNGKRYFVGVVREAGKAPWLRTHENGRWNDHLLAQPECLASCALIG